MIHSCWREHDGLGSTIDWLQQCIETIHGWCSSRRLQLNPSKTEVMWFCTKTSLKKIENKDLKLHVGNDVIGFASSVCDLGVIMDTELSMKKHISKVTSVCYFHLWRLKTVRRILDKKTIASLVTVFIISWLDYCNSILAGVRKSTIMPLQRVKNAAARLICAIVPRDQMTPSLRDLHWLPQELRIIVKLCSLMHCINTDHSPQFLWELVLLTSDIAAARLICAIVPHDHVSPSLCDLHWLPMEQHIIFKLCFLMHCINTDHCPQFLWELVLLSSDIASRSECVLQPADAMRC